MKLFYFFMTLNSNNSKLSWTSMAVYVCQAIILPKSHTVECSKDIYYIIILLKHIIN